MIIKGKISQWPIGKKNISTVRPVRPKCFCANACLHNRTKQLFSNSQYVQRTNVIKSRILALSFNNNERTKSLLIHCNYSTKEKCTHFLLSPPKH